MENEITNIKVCMQEQRTDISYIKVTLNELKEDFKSFSEKCDKKYAPKQTENDLHDLKKTLTGVVITLGLGSLISLLVFLIQGHIQF